MHINKLGWVWKIVILRFTYLCPQKCDTKWRAHAAARSLQGADIAYTQRMYIRTLYVYVYFTAFISQGLCARCLQSIDEWMATKLILMNDIIDFLCVSSLAHCSVSNKHSAIFCRVAHLCIGELGKQCVLWWLVARWNYIRQYRYSVSPIYRGWWGPWKGTAI